MTYPFYVRTPLSDGTTFVRVPFSFREPAEDWAAAHPGSTLIVTKGRG